MTNAKREEIIVAMSNSLEQLVDSKPPKAEHNVISVRRTSNYTAERGTYTDTTKTKRSQRALKISPYLIKQIVIEINRGKYAYIASLI